MQEVELKCFKNDNYDIYGREYVANDTFMMFWAMRAIFVIFSANLIVMLQ